MSTHPIAPTVWDFIKSNRLAVIATSTPSGVPEAALVYYAADEHLYIFCATFKTSRKLHNLAVNNKVALVIGQEVDAVVLQIEGTAEIIQDNTLKGQVMATLALVGNENPQSFNFPPLTSLSHNTNMEFIKITIEWFKFSRFESDVSSIIEGKPHDWKEYTLK